MNAAGAVAGAVPILTLNPQHTLGHNTNLPDSWQHRTVYGVSVRGVHLTNPLETVPETTLKPQLASPPTLLVRRADVLSRYTPATDLHQLIDPTLPDWRRLNVLGNNSQTIHSLSQNMFSQGFSLLVSCSYKKYR